MTRYLLNERWIVMTQMLLVLIAPFVPFAQEAETVRWEDPYGRYSLDVDARWLKDVEPEGAYGREFSYRQKMGKKARDSIRISARVIFHPAEGYVPEALADVERRSLRYFQVSRREEVEIGGREAILVHSDAGEPDDMTWRHVFMPAHVSVLEIQFSCVAPDPDAIDPIVQGFLEGLDIADGPPPPLHLDRSPIRYAVGDAARIIPSRNVALPVIDATGLMTVAALPEGWRVLEQPRVHLLRGLAFERTDPRARIFLCPLPIPDEMERDAPDPTGDIARHFWVGPVHGDPPEPPETAMKTEQGEIYTGALGEESPAILWWFTLRSADLRVLVILLWDPTTGADPRNLAGEILGAVEIQKDGVLRIPEKMQKDFLVHVLNLTPFQVSRTDAIYAHLWSFDRDGRFVRDLYGSLPPKRIRREMGLCRFVDRRLLFLYHDDGTLEAMPMEISSRPRDDDGAIDSHDIHEYERGEPIFGGH